MRTCCKCGKEKDALDFKTEKGRVRKDGTRGPDRVRKDCKECQAIGFKAWRESHKEHCDLKRKEWKEKHPEKWKQIITTNRNKPESKESQKLRWKTWYEKNREYRLKYGRDRYKAQTTKGTPND